MYGISVLEDAIVVTRKNYFLMLYRLMHSIYTFVSTELHKPGAYLFPVRVFMAVGWLRTCVEKLMDPSWLSGTTLTTFLTQQTHSGAVVFSFYQQIIDTLFLPHVVALSWTVLVGELLVGMGLAFGLCTRGALLGGLFMNTNFLLVGRPDPNAFYLIIQPMLLLGKADRVLSLENLWAHMRNRGHLTQPKAFLGRPLVGKVMSAGCTVGFAAIAVYAFVHITNFAPDASVKDPASVLCVLAHVGLGLSLITFVRRTSPALLPFEHNSSRAVDCQAGAAAVAPWIGKIKPFLRRHRPPERPAARRSAAQRDFGWCWTGVSGWGRGAPQGYPRTDPAARAEAERYRQEQMAVVEATFRREPADSRWASEAAVAVQEALASDEIGQNLLLGLECRSHTCRVEMADDNTGELAKVLH